MATKAEGIANYFVLQSLLINTLIWAWDRTSNVNLKNYPIIHSQKPRK